MSNAPEYTSIHYTTVARHIPEWMKKAPARTHRALRDSLQNIPPGFEQACRQKPQVARALAQEHARHREHTQAVATLFEGLPELQAFATARLTEGVKARFDLEVDVARTWLIDARLIDTDRARDGRDAVDRATRSLLHCALHNFEASASVAGGMDAPQALLKKSAIVDHRRFMGTVPLSNVLDIAPEQFADLCRSLDIGGEYHKQVYDIYYPAAEPGEGRFDAANRVYQTLARMERSAFVQSVHLALIRQDIGEALYAAALATPLEPLSAEAHPPTPATHLTFSTLTLWDAELCGLALLTLPAHGAAQPGCVALYNPHDASTPLKQYPSFAALKHALADRLRADITYLDHCLAGRDKPVVSRHLNDRLRPFRWSTSGVHERQTDPDATLEPLQHAFGSPFLDVMVTQKVAKHEKDVVFQAVPTRIVDTLSAKAHRERLAGAALTVLNVGGLLIPGLGELMLAVCALQLASEVYDGIEAWATDDKEQACTYLLDVAKNVAALAAQGAAGSLIGQGVGTALEGWASERITVETPSFIETLDDVELPDASVRLWKPDLAPYAWNIDLPPTLRPDARGLLQHQDRQWLMLDDRPHSVRQASTAGDYVIESPSAGLRFEPPLRHNGAGAWLHGLDLPVQWDELALFRRAGHLSARFDDQTALRILRVSDIHEDVLRKVVTENQRLPALLEDTLLRFDIDQTLGQIPAPVEPIQRYSDFEHRYNRLPTSERPGAEVIRHRYAALPDTITEELLRNASADEVQALATGRLPLRLAEEIRVYQQQVRLTRAYEGLYLHSVRNPDTDLLALHSLMQAPGWPAELRIIVEQRLRSPARTDSIGPVDAANARSIISAHGGYFALTGEHADPLPSPHASLYGALFDVLTPAQRTALAVTDGSALRALAGQAPLLPRDTLSTLLGMQPLRPGYRSPMRLADGRLGYPLGGTRPRAASVSRQYLLTRIRQIGQDVLVPAHAEQVLTALEHRQLGRADIDTLLNELLDQRNELQSRLADWRELSNLLGRPSADAFTQLSNTLLQHWYDRAFLHGNEDIPALRLHHLALSDFPLNLPAFFTDGVTDLQLVEPLPEAFAGWQQHEPQLTRLLTQFANLRAFEVTRPYQPTAHASPFQFSPPLIARYLPQLESLSLINQNISLSSTDIDSLAGLNRLRRLDLSGNLLSGHYPPTFNQLALDYLGLDHMNLEHWPDGLDYSTLTRLGQISLRDNRIRILPSLLLDDRVNMPGLATLSLQGNAIVDEHLQRILLSNDGRATRIELDQSEAFRARLAFMLEQRQQLRSLIDGFVNAATSTATPSQAMMASRNRVATALNEFWHAQEMGTTQTPLRLSHVAVDQFPGNLPEFFTERVRNLTLEQVSGSTSQLANLLGQLRQITRLTLDGFVQAQQSLPSAFLRLPSLNHLAMRNLHLDIDQQVIDTLAGIGNLLSLDLSGNRAGTINSVPGTLQTLRRLDLNEMNLTQWPAWVDQVLPLEILDLSDNRLEVLPDHILSNLDSGFPITSILLFNNPLSDATVGRARTLSDSRHSYTFGLDHPESSAESDDGALFGHFHGPLLDPAADTPNLDDWLLGSTEENQAMRDCWTQLQASGDASNLLALVGRLRQAAPYRGVESRVAFSQRVRRVLVIAHLNAEDLAVFNAQASEALVRDTGDQTCHDGALLVFQNIELFIAGQRLQTEAADTEANLYLELRRLYRLHALDEVAQSETGNRDAAELRLFYRRELNAELHLGLPGDSMLYGVNTTPEELSYAAQQVQRGENGEAFLRFAAGNERWVELLRRTHGERFAAIDEAYQADVLALPDRFPDRPVDSLTEEFRQLERSKQIREQHLIRELTSLARPLDA